MSEPYDLDQNDPLSESSPSSDGEGKKLNPGSIGKFEVSPFGTFILAIVEKKYLCLKYLQILPEVKILTNGCFFQEFDQ